MLKALLAVLAALLCACGTQVAHSAPPAAQGPGFRSQTQFDEHFQKHGSEFGSITQQEYLSMAQQLRDAQAGGPILEQVRADGVISRFDQNRGSFGAYNPDRTIRTFFVPNDGERYFWRQAGRSH